MDTQYSVLLSLYYKEKPEYLRNSLDSVFNQTLVSDDVVLVEDGRLGDALESVVKEYEVRYPQLHVVRFEKNRGLGFALNDGLTYCKHELVARMDTDDIAKPHRMEKQFAFMQAHPEIGMVGSWTDEFITDIHQIESVRKVPEHPKEVMEYAKKRCPVNHPTVMYRKNAILSVGGYKPDAGPRQDDYDLWFRCAEKGLHFANISEPSLHYRFFADSVRKNSIEVGWHRMKIGLRGCRRLHLSFIAYIGVCIPFVRSLLPYPLNVYFQGLMNRMNPRKMRE